MDKNEEPATDTATSTETVTSTTTAASTSTTTAILLLLMSMITGIFLVNNVASGAAGPVDPHFFLLEDLLLLLIVLGILVGWFVSLGVVILADALTETKIKTSLLISTLSLVPALVALTISMTGTTPILRPT